MKKLNDAQRNEIREFYAAGGVTQRELGELYGVDQSVISAIVNPSRTKASKLRYSRSKNGREKRLRWRNSLYGQAVSRLTVANCTAKKLNHAPPQILPKELEHLLSSHSKCEICSVQFSSNCEKMLDHSHVSGAVRGILCDSCNFVLGHAKDSTAILANAIEYLSRQGGAT